MGGRGARGRGNRKSDEAILAEVFGPPASPAEQTPAEPPPTEHAPAGPPSPTPAMDPCANDDQRDALMRIGWTRNIPRSMENQLADLGLVDTRTGWLTPEGERLFNHWTAGDSGRDITRFHPDTPH